MTLTMSAAMARFAHGAWSGVEAPQRLRPLSLPVPSKPLGNLKN
jgi:hypothetical protein